jgi:AcrR family transcriptional regulator
MRSVPKARRSRTLTRDAILDESLRIVRRQGVSGLTMRAVAAELGVTPMAVYYYVADKDDLLRLVVDRVNASIGLLHLRPNEEWQQSLRAYLVNTWESTSTYPGLSARMINLPGLGVTPERLTAGLAFFDQVGFAPADAHLAWSFALTYIHGRLSVDAHLSHRQDALHADGLKAREYVEFGVEAVIKGLETMLEYQGGAAPPHSEERS